MTTDTDRRGAQVFAQDLAAGLVDHPVEVRTVALAEGRVGGLAVDRILGPSRRHPLTWGALHGELRSADAAIAHGSTTLPMAALTGPPVPVVYRQISDSRFWAPDARRRLQTRLALGRMAHVVALHEGAASTLTEFHGVPADKITIIPNAVPAAGFHPPTAAERQAARQGLVEGETLLVGYVGALVPEKGVDRLLDAVRDRVGVHVVVAGDGPSKSDLETMARRLGVSATFLGSVTNPTCVYRALDLLSLPSRGGDSMPAVLIEAGLCGVPVATTDVGGIPEIVLDGHTGWVAPHGDEEAVVESIREALDVTVSDRLARGGAAARHTRQFTIASVTPQWLDVISQVVAA